jgi:RNA polymerase sigma-70 factor (ECF subfamily)
VFALLSRALRGHCDATSVEDIAQETFLRVFRALPSFERTGPARLSTWILTIASHRAIDELRRRRHDTQPLESAVYLAAADRTDEFTERRMLAAMIDEAIADLKAEYRAAFVLREYHGLDYTEIASALGVEVGTIKSRLNRARTRLREALSRLHEEIVSKRRELP